MEMTKGERIEKIMWLVEGKVIQGQKGPYWAGKFMIDKESVPAKIWQNRHFDEQVKLLVPANPYAVKATVDEYNGLKQIIINTVERHTGAFDKSQMLPSSALSKGDLVAEFESIVESVADEDYRNLLKAFRNSDLFEGYSVAPAAKAVHHAWISGLLEHSLGLAKAILALSPLYPELDKDLLLTGAFLHDAGKALEISAEPGFDYTTEGKLFGHIYMGAKLTEDLICGISGFPESKKRQIVHLILSHQGARSEGFGSPVDPSTVEAVFFHHIDNLDAKVRHCLTEVKKSEFVSGFIQTPLPMKISLYLGEADPREKSTPPEDRKISKPRSGLFPE